MTKIYSFSASLKSDCHKDGIIASSDLALKAGEDVCKGVPKETIDAVLFGTMTRDCTYPSSACMLTSKMGITNAFAFDIESDYSSFINALVIGKAFIDGGRYKRILVVGADMLTTFSDNPIFSDGAAAMLLTSDLSGHELLFASSTTDGSKLQNCYIPMGGSAEPNTKEGLRAGRNKIHLKSENVFTEAAKEATKYYKEILQKNNIKPNVFTSSFNTEKSHAAFVEEMTKLDMPKIYAHGETCAGASACGLSFVNAVKEGVVKKGDTVAICAYGSGNTTGIAVINF